jgi:lipopolysaccharide heptosyltransferase I
MTAPARILVVRLGSLGDLIHTLPAVNALRVAHPEAVIDWLVDAPHRQLLDLVPVLSAVLALERPTLAGWREARRRLRLRRYDVALDFQGLVKSAVLARLSGARRVVGFDRPALREPAASWFYSETMAVGEPGHVIAKNMRLAAAVGASDDQAPEFPLRSAPSAALDAVRAGGLTRFALINGGAAWPNKRWPAERFGRVAAWLAERHGLRSVALWGPGEQNLARAIVEASRGAAVAAPPTGLPDLLALARQASLMLSGDTGPTHIAAAVSTPVVALFGPTDPERNGPWSSADRVVSRHSACDCPYQRRCRREPSRWCLGDITESDVRAAIDARLEATGHRSSVHSSLPSPT